MSAAELITAAAYAARDIGQVISIAVAVAVLFVIVTALVDHLRGVK